MDGANEVAGFIESVGIPVATVVLFAAGGWWLIRYILTEIVRKSSEDKDEIKQQIEQLHKIVVALIDKNQLLASDLLRLDTMLRVKWLDLPPDEKRISRNPSSEVK